MSESSVEQFWELTKNKLQIYLWISILLFLFVLFFQPFSTKAFEFENKVLFFAGLGLIAFLFLLLNQFFFHNLLLRPERDEPNDSVLFHLYYTSLAVTTSVGFTFYLRYVGGVHITFSTVVKIVCIGVSLPVSLHINGKLASYQERLKVLFQENHDLKTRLHKLSEIYTTKSIEILSENDADSFSVQISALVFAKSANNYVEIGYMSEGEIKKRLLRNTLKHVERQLREYNIFIRTHRTSLVNIEFIDTLNKQFNSYWLSLKKTDEIIPVSRQYLLKVKGLL